MLTALMHFHLIHGALMHLHGRIYMPLMHYHG